MNLLLTERATKNISQASSPLFYMSAYLSSMDVSKTRFTTSIAIVEEGEKIKFVPDSMRWQIIFRETSYLFAENIHFFFFFVVVVVNLHANALIMRAFIVFTYPLLFLSCFCSSFLHPWRLCLDDDLAPPWVASSASPASLPPVERQERRRKRLLRLRKAESSVRLPPIAARSVGENSGV